MHAQSRPAGHHQRQQRPPRKAFFNPRTMPWVILGGLLSSGIVIMMLIVGVYVLYSGSGSDIASGVTVAGIPVGGQTAQAAARTLEAENLTQRPLRLTDGTRSWIVTLAEMGVGVDIEATVEMAQDAPAGTDIQPWYTIDLTQTQMKLVSLSDQVNIPAVSGSTPQTGRAMEIPTTLNRLYLNLAGEIGDGVLELDMIEVQPAEDEKLVNYTGQTTVHVVEQGQELGLIARQYGVTVEDIMALNEIDDPNLIYAGQELIIPAAGEYEPPAAEAPPAPTNAGRSIVVSIDKQRIYAYENGVLVHSHLVSTGLPDTPTVLGDYKVYVKYVADDMAGPDYFLPQVPYTMYFYQGYAIHGTYWHNAFGRPMSHGCVNLPVDEAKWFFEFAEVGTPVRVIA